MKKKKKLIKRICLACGQKFETDNKFIRICDRCRRRNAAIYYREAPVHVD